MNENMDGCWYGDKIRKELEGLHLDQNSEPLPDYSILKELSLDEKLNLPILDAGIHARTAGIFETMGILIIADIIKIGSAELVKRKNIGPSTIDKINEVLINLGLNGLWDQEISL